MVIRRFMDIVESVQKDVLTELSRPEERSDAYAVLKAAGYQSRGIGSFAGVFQKPGTTYVLKVFDTSDKAYLAYIDLVRKHPDNPHFPRINGKTVRITSDYYAIRMEPLTMFDWRERKHEETMISSYMHFRRLADRQWFQEEPPEIYQEALAFVSTRPELKEACDLVVANLTPEFRLDINTNNLMMRGQTIVLTDPVAVINQ